MGGREKSVLNEKQYDSSHQGVFLRVLKVTRCNGQGYSVGDGKEDEFRDAYE